MSAWSGVLALSGFRYHGAEKSASIMPRLNVGGKFSCFWSAAPAWGAFTHAADSGRRRVSLAVTEGNLPLRSIALAPGPVASPSARLQGRPLALSHALPRHDREGVVFTFTDELTIHAGEELVLLA